MVNTAILLFQAFYPWKASCRGLEALDYKQHPAFFLPVLFWGQKPSVTLHPGMESQDEREPGNEIEKR